MEAPHNLMLQHYIGVQILSKWDPADRKQLQSSSRTKNWNYHSQTRHYPENGLETKHIAASGMSDYTLIQQKQQGHLEGRGEEKPLKNGL